MSSDSISFYIMNPSLPLREIAMDISMEEIILLCHLSFIYDVYIMDDVLLLYGIHIFFESINAYKSHICVFHVG